MTIYPHGSHCTQPPQIAKRASVAALVQSCVDDIHGFSVEKHGIAPEIAVTDESCGASAFCMPPHVSHALAEVLKNAVQALVDKHGAWDVDEAEPINVSIKLLKANSDMDNNTTKEQLSGAQDAQLRSHSKPGTLRRSSIDAFVAEAHQDEAHEDATHYMVAVADSGNGMDSMQLAAMQRFFATTTPDRAPQYGYSKAHGAQYSGLGVGIPMTRMYVEFMGGHAGWDSGNWGTQATIVLPLQGFELGASSAVLDL